MAIGATGGINLQQLFSEPLAPAAVSAPGAGALPLVRLALAVRGWVEPMALAAHLAGDSAGAVIAALASEVETAAATRPGQWFLTVEARRRAIVGAKDSDLRRALSASAESDPEDMVLQAVRVALGTTPVDLADLPDGVLRALANVRDWVGDRWQQSFGRDEIDAALAGRVLDADLARMTSLPLVGRTHARVLASLERFACDTGADGLRAVYVHATGGGGKTTLLAFLQRALLAKAQSSAIVRIDFDEPGIDPARMVTLNLALVEQLAGSLPRIREFIGDFLPQLRGAAAALLVSDYTDGSPRGGWSSGKRGRGSLMGQRQLSESVSDQASILYGLLAPDTLRGPLVLVLDTAELVMDGNVRAAAGVADWIGFLRSEAQARDIRLIVAGRDPPPEQADADGLLARLARIGAVFDSPQELPELNPSESAQLLGNCGVTEPRLRMAAAEAVPGNPLLLRITADALLQSDAELLTEIRAAHAKSQVDRQSAQRYLMRRVVAHVSDPMVRPYVIAAMASPILTSAMLGAAIIPLVDQQRRQSVGVGRPNPGAAVAGGAAEVPVAGAGQVGGRKLRRIFAGIERTAWLGRMSLDGKRFTFNRDLRRFVMTLVAAIPEDQALHHRTHAALRAYHARRRDPLDRALAFFHARMLGDDRRLPRGTGALRILRTLVDQFPEDMADAVAAEVDELLAARQRASPAAKRAAKPAGRTLGGGAAGIADGPGGSPPIAGATSGEVDSQADEQQWRLYLEGRAGVRGQGAQLVGDDRAADALDMYRARPTRPPGAPPTFVIQALADLGQWDGADVDVAAVVAEVSHGISARDGNAGIDRAYWLTRYALQRDPGQLTRAHRGLLRQCVDYLKGPGLASFPPLLALVEAFSGERILPPRLIAGVAGNEGEGRIYLARRQRMARDLAAGLFAVTQRDWLERVRKTGAVPNADGLVGIQQQLNRLHEQPIAMVNQQFLRLRQAFAIQWDGEDTAAGVLLLRGMTAEFLRPLREVLASLADEIGADSLRPVIEPTIRAMTIRPVEMDWQVLQQRLAGNSRAWLSAFISYADRSRLLPGFCENVVATFGDAGAAGRTAARVARSFLAWDMALGGPGDWRSLP